MGWKSSGTGRVLATRQLAVCAPLHWLRLGGVPNRAKHVAVRAQDAGLKPLLSSPPVLLIGMLMIVKGPAMAMHVSRKHMTTLNGAPGASFALAQKRRIAAS